MDPHSFYLLDPDPHSEKLLDLDPQKMNVDPQPCRIVFWPSCSWPNDIQLDLLFRVTH